MQMKPWVEGPLLQCLRIGDGIHGESEGEFECKCREISTSYMGFVRGLIKRRGDGLIDFIYD